MIRKRRQRDAVAHDRGQPGARGHDRHGRPPLVAGSARPHRHTVAGRLHGRRPGGEPDRRPQLAGAALEGPHGEVGQATSCPRALHDRALEPHARPPVGRALRRQDVVLDPAQAQRIDDGRDEARCAVVEPAGAFEEPHPRVVLEVVPERQCLLGHPDIAGVRVGVAEDPGGPVTAAPGVPLLELLDQRHRPPPPRQPPRRGRPHRPGPDHHDVDLLRHAPSLPLTQEAF